MVVINDPGNGKDLFASQGDTDNFTGSSHDAARIGEHLKQPQEKLKAL